MIIKIINQSFWRDEAFHVLLALKSPLEVFSIQTGEVNTPIYYIVLHYWIKLFGSTELATRSFSVLTHFLLAVVIFFLIKAIWKKWEQAIVTALIVLFNPFLLVFGFEASIYSLLALLVATAVLGTVTNRTWLTIIAITLAIYTAHFAWLVYIGIMLFHLLKFRKERKWLDLVTITVIPIFLLIPSIILFTKQIGRIIVEGLWIGPIDSRVFIDLFREFAYGSHTLKVQPMLYNLTVVLTVFAASVWLLKHEVFKEEIMKVATLAILTFLPIIGLYLFSMYRPIFWSRYLMYTTPLLITLIAGSVYRVYGVINENLKKFLLVLISFYFILLIQGAEEFMEKEFNPPIREAVKDTVTQIATGDIVVAESVLNYLETKYYLYERFDRKDIPLKVLEPSGKIVYYVGSVMFDSNALITELPKDKRVWLIKRDGSKELIQPTM